MAIHGRHDGTPASRPSNRPPAVFRRRQIGAGRWLGKSSQPPDGLRLRRPCEGRWRLNRDRKQLGFATIKVFGHQNCPRTVVNQAFRVKPILARQAIKRHRPCRNRLVSLDVWVGLIDTVNHCAGAIFRCYCRCRPDRDAPGHRWRCLPSRCWEFPGGTDGRSGRRREPRRAGGDCPSRCVPNRYQRAAGS